MRRRAEPRVPELLEILRNLIEIRSLRGASQQLVWRYRYGASEYVGCWSALSTKFQRQYVSPAQTIFAETQPEGVAKLFEFIDIEKMRLPRII